MVERVREVFIEKHGDLNLVVGGKHGYVRVRGGQGKTKDQYQGYTKCKKHSTAAYLTPREAAKALAELERDLAAGLDKAARKKRKADACARLHTYPNPLAHFPLASLPTSLTVYPMCQCVPQIESMRTRILRRHQQRWRFRRAWDHT